MPNGEAYTTAALTIRNPGEVSKTRPLTAADLSEDDQSLADFARTLFGPLGGPDLPGMPRDFVHVSGHE